LHNAINAARHDDKRKATVIYLSPQGKPLTQQKVRQWSAMPENRLILVAGRYEGIDERVIINDVDEEWSIGDYVLSGGELPAMVLIDAITRLLPGALGDSTSAQHDSFENGLLDHPHYTRPETIDGLSVPSVLQSGDHSAILTFRRKQSIGKTWQKRPDLLKRRILNAEERKLLQMYIDENE
jgi:tRNA (guanine37-N1)-methyltransferase